MCLSGGLGLNTTGLILQFFKDSLKQSCIVGGLRFFNTLFWPIGYPFFNQMSTDQLN